MILRATGSGRFAQIVVNSAPGHMSRGVLIADGVRAVAALGRGGIGRVKLEGDGRTPAGRFRFLHVFYRPDRVSRPPTVLPVATLRPDLGWCDDPSDRNYNRPVRLPYPARYERLWRQDGLYDILVVIDFNVARPRAGGGSAIVLHIASPDFAPTEGCIAVRLPILQRLLANAGPRTTLHVR
jgi:L,D-peptidoglycan transpeptidase YkuD (ErfK/YbiS/YcfS/YnhG family)